ncbi:MAG: anti-sigma factor family protein [Beutenbergiaceae bacterium]
MNHLGSLVTPYVDGELRAAQMQAVADHLTACEQCRRLVAAERAARLRTRRSATALQPAPELTARLLAMPHGLSSDHPAAPRHLRRGPLLLGGGLSLVGLFAITLFILGAPPPGQTPAALLEVVDDDSPSAVVASNVGSGALEDVAENAALHWSAPEGLTVVDRVLLDAETQTVDLTVVGPAGQVRLVQRFGAIDTEAALITPRPINGHWVYQVQDWWVVDSGTSVIALQGSDDAMTAVLNSLPPRYEPGPLDRIRDGWVSLVS